MGWIDAFNAVQGRLVSSSRDRSDHESFVDMLYEHVDGVMYEVREKSYGFDDRVSVSSLYSFCPRAATILAVMGARLERRTTPRERMRMIYGTALHKVYQEDVLGDKLVGGWVCARCGFRVGFESGKHEVSVESSIHKPAACAACGGGTGQWHYVEPRIEIPTHNVSGRIDGLINNNGRMAIIDIKTVEDAAYMARIAEPRESDSVQINVYQYASGIDDGYVVYIPRQLKSSSLPSSDGDTCAGTMMKVLPVERNDGLVRKYLGRVAEFRSAAKRLDEELSGADRKARFLGAVEQAPRCPFGGSGPYGPCECSGLQV